MPDQEIEMLDVEIILKASHQDRNELAVKQLEAAGLQIVEVNPEAAIEGTIPADRLAGLEKLECVSYVRTILEYGAKPPAAEGTPSQ